MWWHFFVYFAIGWWDEIKFEDERQKGVWSFLRRLASIYPSGELPGLLTKEQLEKEVLAWTYFCRAYFMIIKFSIQSGKNNMLLDPLIALTLWKMVLQRNWFSSKVKEILFRFIWWSRVSATVQVRLSSPTMMPCPPTWWGHTQNGFLTLFTPAGAYLSNLWKII